MKKSTCTLLAVISIVSLFMSTASIAQNNPPFWSLTGNNNGSPNLKLGTTNGLPLKFFTNDFERMRIDANGRVGIGTTSPVNLLTVKLSGGTPSALWLSGGSPPAFLAFGEDMSTGFNLATASNIFNHRPVFNTRRSRGTLAAPAAVATNDLLASFVASGYDGSGFNNPATIDFYVDSTPGLGNVPGRISFVTGSNVNNRTERLKIGSTGNVTFNNNQLFLQKATGAIGVNTLTPHPSAIVDIQSTNKGFLTSRMTLAQRNAIQNPATGLLIFQTNGIPGFYYFNGSWQPVTTPGNTVTGANTSLSNLSSTAINTHLLPGVGNFLNIGSYNLPWKDIYISGTLYKDGTPFISTPGSSTFVGNSSGNPGVSGAYNTGFGFNTLLNISTGERNTAIGAQSLMANTTGTNNTGVGLNALHVNTTGYGNTAVGGSALTFSNGSGNTAIGTFALVYSKSGSANTAVGATALRLNSTGDYNTAVAIEALVNNTTGNNNTGIGYHSLYNNEANSFNTAVGDNAGYYNTSNSTFLGAGATSNAELTNVTAIGYNAFATTDNQVTIGNTAVTSIGGQVGWSAFSDGRFKKNIKEDVPGLEFINKLRPVTYNLDIQSIDKALSAHVAQVAKRPVGDNFNLQETNWVPSPAEIKSKLEKAGIKYTGFVAQEVEKAASSLDYDFSGVDKPKNNKDFYGLRYSEFVVPLVVAVQELSKKAEKIDELEAKNKMLEARLAKLEAIINTASANTQFITSSLAYLEQNIPNPSGGSTIINYHLPANTLNAKILISDVKGSLIKAINVTGKGNGKISLARASALPAGTYTYTLFVDGRQADSKQMIITR